MVNIVVHIYSQQNRIRRNPPPASYQYKSRSSSFAYISIHIFMRIIWFLLFCSDSLCTFDIGSYGFKERYMFCNLYVWIGYIWREWGVIPLRCYMSICFPRHGNGGWIEVFCFWCSHTWIARTSISVLYEHVMWNGRAFGCLRWVNTKIDNRIYLMWILMALGSVSSDGLDLLLFC